MPDLFHTPSDNTSIKYLSMRRESRHISVCICTFQRPVLLQRLLGRLEQQRTDNQFAYSIVVADHDARLSAQPVVAKVMATSRIEATYCSESRQNIALARN